MNSVEWDLLQRCARLEDPGQVPVALIVDSPWIPGYLGISTLDYFTHPDVWLDANLRICAEFPRAIFLPGFWVEWGMTAEPSGFGCRLSFYADKTPVAHSLLGSVSEVEGLKQPDPRQDGVMPLVINQYRFLAPRVRDAGHAIKIVAARGPLATAAHLLGVTNFLLGVKLDPQPTHKLLAMTTQLIIDWLQAQAEALPDAEGIMLLDDLVGFLSPADYREFAHPYMQRIFDAFPGTLKIFHNDMDNLVSFPHMAELGVQIFNFTHKRRLDRVRAETGPDVCLMGNVAPLDVLGQGSPDEVRAAVADCYQAHPERRGLILSVGGGVSPGTPAENIRALLDAADAWS